MPNVQFDSDQSEPKEKDRGKMVNFIRDKLGVNGETARNILIGVGIVILLISLYFWFQVLF